MSNEAERARAELAFKKEQQQREGVIAWKEYEDKRTSQRANMARLRKLRLDRDAKTSAAARTAPPTSKRAKRVGTG